MIIKNATFITSAARAEQFIAPDKPMIAVCGKSNVGKSSLINMLANQKKLAKTSSSPGRTRLVNYFDFGEFLLADLPGYGYAQVSKIEKEKWAKTLENFFKRSQDIAHVLVLIDIRHGATEDDMALLELLNYYIIPFTVVFTKADKLSRMKINEHAKKIADSMCLTRLNTIVTSSEKRIGKEELLAKIESVITKE
ncbi:MAG: YihA family ribosome biogenesis GTP-binding protein [Clostridia bacterium]|nr:YihA family ribosome biogenesis GTP-binding protein [Clostridia bacterium]